MAHFRKHILESGPRYLYEYYVVGSGQFPFDMLRYDHCWPCDGEAASRIDTAFTPVNERCSVRSIDMIGCKEPDVERWASFGWSVGLIDMMPRSNLAATLKIYNKLRDKGEEHDA